jgi:hypothetical protein
MNKQQAIEVLKAHNEWRRGNNCDLETPLPMQNPKDIGEEIDVAIAALSDETVTLPNVFSVCSPDCEICANIIKNFTPVSTAVTLPDGWVAVPVEPTDEMLEAGGVELIKAITGRPNLSWADESKLAYKAMLQAAPTCEKEKG